MSWKFVTVDFNRKIINVDIRLQQGKLFTQGTFHWIKNYKLWWMFCWKDFCKKLYEFCKQEKENKPLLSGGQVGDEL